MRTKKIAIFCAALVWAVVLLSLGCGKGSSYSLLSDSDTFQQNEGAFNSKIDILWVIDNSGSMESSQQAVINNLNSFMADFVAKDLDFKMAVTSTDAFRDEYMGTHKCAVFRDGLLNINCNPVSGNTYTGVRVMDRFTPNLMGVFAINTLLTDTVRNIYSNGDERAFQSMSRALTGEPLNAGFLRPDSFLSVIIVSDEDDFSYSGATPVEQINSTYANNPWSYPNLHTIQSYVDYLDTLTGSTATSRRYHVNAMSIFDEPCRVQLSDSFPRKRGIRYEQLIDSVNSGFDIPELRGRKGSLCGNFADDLRLIAEGTQNLATKFTLQRLPIPSTISVTVNGASVPNQATNPAGDGGWVYDETTNSIFFIGTNYRPAAGSTISVHYDPQAYGQ
jgi:hypothetical protein